jgi:hypothetical protein
LLVVAVAEIVRIQPQQSRLLVTPTTPVFATEEAIAVKDNPSVYAAEESEVLKATVTTTDTDTWTFADVNNDTDDSDASVPEVDAHG